MEWTLRVKARRGRDGEEVPIEVWAHGERDKMVKELVVPYRLEGTALYRSVWNRMKEMGHDPKTSAAELALCQIARVQLQELGYDPRSDTVELVGLLKNVGNPVFHPPQTERINVEERGALLKFLY